MIPSNPSMTAQTSLLYVAPFDPLRPQDCQSGEDLLSSSSLSSWPVPLSNCNPSQTLPRHMALFSFFHEGQPDSRQMFQAPDFDRNLNAIYQEAPMQNNFEPYPSQPFEVQDMWQPYPNSNNGTTGSVPGGMQSHMVSNNPYHNQRQWIPAQRSYTLHNGVSDIVANNRPTNHGGYCGLNNMPTLNSPMPLNPSTVLTPKASPDPKSAVIPSSRIGHGFSPLQAPVDISSQYGSEGSPASSTRSPYTQLETWESVLSLPTESNFGPFIPQATYKPHTNSDRKRYVEEIVLGAPLYFTVEHPSEHGISLSDALHTRVRRLTNRDQPVFEGRGPSISIRLEWPGYRQWTRQIPTKDFRSPPRPITMAKLAKNVAKCVQRFIEENKDRVLENGVDRKWKIGTRSNEIKMEDLVLVGLHHVSLGSWQPQLRLRRPRH